MAQNTTITLVKDAWTQLTNADLAAAMTFLNESRYPLRIKATVGATPPTTIDGSILYKAGNGEVATLVGDLFPGVAGANRLYAYTEKTNVKVFVSQA